MEQNKQQMINFNKTNRVVMCLNPNHEMVRFDTNQIGDIKCPMCESPMVTEVKLPLQDQGK